MTTNNQNATRGVEVTTSRYATIVADPPWKQGGMSGGRYQTRAKRPRALSYPTMSIKEIADLPIGSLAEDDCHLWLWTTNAFLHHGFHVMEAWGFKYLAPIHWLKPSGVGHWFIGLTQTVLFGYKGRCRFPLKRYARNVVTTSVPKRHSEKPTEMYDLIEAVSPGPRLELFARTSRPGWHVWGNEVESDVAMGGAV